VNTSLSIFGGELSQLGVEITTNEELPSSRDGYRVYYFCIEVVQEGWFLCCTFAGGSIGIDYTTF